MPPTLHTLLRPIACRRAVLIARPQIRPALLAIPFRAYSSDVPADKLEFWRQWSQAAGTGAPIDPASVQPNEASGAPEAQGQAPEGFGVSGAGVGEQEYAQQYSNDPNVYQNPSEMSNYQFESFDNFPLPSEPTGLENVPSAEEAAHASRLAASFDDANSSTSFSSPILTESLNYPLMFHPPPTPHHIDPAKPVSKYPLPTLPLPSTSHLHYRYSPLMDLVVNLFMRDGKKATAQAHLQRVLDILRTKPPPKEQTKFNLIANAPALDQLPKNPLAYLQTAIDSVAPLMRLKSAKGSGGFSNQVPEPLNERQRRRTAIGWMLAVSNGKADKMRFAERFADEVVAVVEGRSAAWDRRLQVHKTAVGARANVKVKL
ncbi:ribosomal protein S7 domain-containing protein [Peziza echinospora]|nr:ribosomal protein S7 domain-containing protein [Peziza echinospora]